MFVEGNEKIFSKTSVQFFNLHFKNNMKVYSNSNVFPSWTNHGRYQTANFTNVYVCFIDVSHHFLMIQWGTGNFEYSINDVAILSGQICFMDDTDLDEKLEKTATFGKTSDDFLEYVSKDEIYALLEHNGFNLGDNFKNIFDLKMYKNNIQGNIKWINDWIYLLDGVFKLPLFENISACLLEAPVFIREIHIIPSKIMNSNEKSKYNVSINMCRTKGVFSSQRCCIDRKTFYRCTGPLQCTHKGNNMQRGKNIWCQIWTNSVIHACGYKSEIRRTGICSVQSSEMQSNLDGYDK